MPKKTGDLGMIGGWAFIIGLVIALLAALIAFPSAGFILVILGLLVGFLNITTKETTGFLIATIALMLVGSAGLVAFPTIGVFLGNFLTNIVIFVAPAALVVSLKAIYALAKS